MKITHQDDSLFLAVFGFSAERMTDGEKRPDNKTQSGRKTKQTGKRDIKEIHTRSAVRG